jgi:hypothetical protein
VIKNNRDIYYLLNKYKEDNNGAEANDICVLFNYWQSNFGPNSPYKSSTLVMNDDKTLINFNSKSFNNKTYLPISGNNRDASPII